MHPLVIWVVAVTALAVAIYYPSALMSIACYLSGYLLGVAMARHQIIKAQNRKRRISD